MIGASGAAMGLVSSPAPPGVQPGTTGSSAPADTAVAPEAAPSSTASRSGNTGRAATTHPQSSAQENGATATSVRTDFASLLLAGADAGTPAATTSSATLPEDEAADPNAVDTPPLPDQLLALLDGSWMKPASPTPAAAPMSATLAVDSSSAANTTLPERAPAAGIQPAADVAAGALLSLADAVTSRTAVVASADALSADASANASFASPGAAAPDFPAITPALATTPIARAITAAPVTVPANPQAGFDDGFGARLVWMAEQRLGHAEIRLNPEHLGPIDVRVQVDGMQVNAEFHSGHAVVRQAIEASLPRLREMLGQQGLQLGQADVGQRQAGSGQPGREGPDTQPSFFGSATANSQMTMQPLRSRGLLDEYA